MPNSVKIQARLSEENLIVSWVDYRKDFIKHTGINPTDSDVLGFILYKTNDVHSNYLKRSDYLKGKDRTKNEESELSLLNQIVENLQEG